MPPYPHTTCVVMDNNEINCMLRNSSDIMGQRKIEGVDGEHRYFDLKVKLATATAKNFAGNM
jgi:hypothetical protein